MKLMFVVGSIGCVAGLLLITQKAPNDIGAYVAVFSALVTIGSGWTSFRPTRSNISVRLVTTGHLQHAVIIENIGEKDVCDLNVSIDSPPGKAPIIDQQYIDEMIPTRSLPVGSRVDFPVGLSFDTGSRFTARWNWKTSKFGRQERRELTRTPQV